MKKVILGAAALMIGAVAFAQENTATTPDILSGATLDPVENKSTATDANRAATVQAGFSNKVQVAQAGTSQSAFVDQDGIGEGLNVAQILQTGAVGEESGLLNAAAITQSGQNNGARAIQQGDVNAIIIDQEDGDGDGGNQAVVQQGTGQQAQFNAAEVYQTGTTNSANVLQTYDRSSALVEQAGVSNLVDIGQNAGNNLSDGHEAIALQVGANNEATVFQTGDDPADDTGSNTAFVGQFGSDNASKQLQSTIAGDGEVGETATINQGLDISGNFGTTLANQTQFDVVGGLNTLDGDIFPDDSFNASNGAEAVQVQTGKMNEAEINQFGEPGNEAQQMQSGWAQDAFIVQNANGTDAGGNNLAIQTQSGDRNTAGISQNGFNHKAQQVQSSNRNVALSAQRGEGNVVSTNQSGPRNHAHTLQNGQFNEILVVQEGGHSAMVSQNAGAFGPTNGFNEANIYQTGPNGDISTQGFDCEVGEIMTIDELTPVSVSIDALNCPTCE